MYNKPYIKTVIAIIVIIITVTIGWLVMRNKHISPASVSAPVPDQVNNIDPTDKEIAEKGDLYEVSIHYPYYNNPVIDNEIKKYIDDAHGEFLKAFETLDSVFVDMFSGDNKGFLTITYAIKKSPTISTVVFHGSEFTGGAHPTPFIFTISTDSKGKLIQLSDVFSVSTPEYLTVLSAYSSDVLAKKYGDAFFKEGADTNPENWNHWYMDENGNLVVLFGAYQVAPYVEGEPEVVIPFSEVKSIIKPEYSNNN